MSLIGFNYVAAQSSLIATLSHENDVKVFYGASALKEAHEAAVGGDIITLSSGTFNSVNITKAITLRGAGMAVDTVNNVMPTILSGDFNISESDSIHNLTMEGLYHNGNMRYSGTLSKAQFIKCRFKSISYSNYYKDYVECCTFLNCRVSSYFSCFGSGNMFCNSIIESCCLHGYGSMFYNCVINMSEYGTPNSMELGPTSCFENCIIVYGGYKSHVFASHVSAYNCIAAGSIIDIFKEVPNETNIIVRDLSDVFKTYHSVATIEKNDDETFELTEEAKTKYLGLDGTQVGIYGGAIPYNTTPAIPKITKCNVAAKSTVDGKLSVDVEVSAE